MARYAKNGDFNVLYPTRRKMANILKKIIMEKGLVQEGTLYDSVRINAKVSGTWGKLEIQILAMYYFIFLNNGAFLWNGGVIPPYEIVQEFTDRMNSSGLTAEIYRQYTEWLTKNYPLIKVVPILEKQQKLVYTFMPIDPPPGFRQGEPLEV
jgi:hypothetical protein